MDIPVEEDEAISPAKGAEAQADKMRKAEALRKQMDGGPIKDASLRAIRSAKDDGELWLVSKKMLEAGEFRLTRVPNGLVHMGPDWIRRDGDPCPEFPTHVYVVANK